MNLAAMRAAAAEVDELLGNAIAIIEEEPGTTTPAAVEHAHDLVSGYVQLASASLQRFEEAARGS
jgi:hypothetical protein